MSKEFLCNDCEVDCWAIGDFYMAQSEIWDKLGLGWTDNLCIGCLEARLGRKVSCPGDIYPVIAGIEIEGRYEKSLNKCSPAPLS
jgi:hypothetical protein